MLKKSTYNTVKTDEVIITFQQLFLLNQPNCVSLSITVCQTKENINKHMSAQEDRDWKDTQAVVHVL